MGWKDEPVSRTPQAYLRGHLVVVIDCADLDRSAEFWTSVLGYARDGPRFLAVACAWAGTGTASTGRHGWRGAALRESGPGADAGGSGLVPLPAAPATYAGDH
jgi:catechol 2,3-dioxygenase-like lactoylglutathione lyase family enzyme